MIKIKNVGAHILGEALFEKFTLAINSGDRIGIVGPNGSGKTTLLKIIAGIHESHEGSIHYEHERVGYLPQDIEYADHDTVQTFITGVPQARRIKVLAEVGLSSISQDARVKELSGGQKRRLALARTLGHGPTFLLLDEPTNHLDRATIEWLEEFIQNFRGGVILISHDRSLLDGVVHKILEINPRDQVIHTYVGNYSSYLIERAKRDRLQNEAHDRQQREKKRIEEWLARKRQEATVHPDPSKGRMIRAKVKYLQREILDKEIYRAGPQKKIHGAHLEGEAARAKLMCRVTDIAKNYGTKNVLKKVSFEVRGQERVLLAGNNGSGKTTLLKILLSQVRPDAGSVKIGDNISVGYFAQEQESLDLNKTILEEFTATPDLVSTQEPRAVLGSFLFSDHDVFRKVGSLSMGERVRLIFAKLTHQKNELLILDEPTNHLDIPSREVIEAALIKYEGAIIAVSHDQFFVKKIGFNRKVEIKNGMTYISSHIT